MHHFSRIHRGVEQLVARQAHNLEVACSSPASATTENASAFFFLLCVGHDLRQVELWQDVAKHRVQGRRNGLYPHLLPRRRQCHRLREVRLPQAHGLGQVAQHQPTSTRQQPAEGWRRQVGVKKAIPTYTSSKLFLLSKKSISPIIRMPFSLRQGLMLSFTMTIFLKESSILTND